MNYANNKKAFLFIFVSIILSLMALIFARYFHEKYYSRIHSFDSVNYNRIDQIKYGFMHYEGGKHYESGKHYATASLSTEGSAKPLSWRVQLLPFFDEKKLYDQILHNEKFDKSQNTLLETPYHYRSVPVRDTSKTSASFLMLPSLSLVQLPVIVEVKNAEFHWHNCEDFDFWNLLNALPNTNKLYEVRDNKFIFCDANDFSVLILAPDENIYFLPVTTTVGTFKKIINIEKIKTLQKTKRGKLTYFQ